MNAGLNASVSKKNEKLEKKILHDVDVFSGMSFTFIHGLVLFRTNPIFDGLLALSGHF